MSANPSSSREAIARGPGLTMRIVFEPSTLLQRKKAGSVTAAVYFDFNSSRQFPVAGWNDFVVVVACWWLDALAQIMQGNEETELRFMDGPYWINAIGRGKDELLLRCIEDREDAEVVFEAVVLVDELKSELFSLAHRLSHECEKKGIESPDLSQLRKHLLN